MSNLANQDPVAIVGMACRLPGADHLDQFWQMLLEGRSAVRPIPESRFCREFYYHPDEGVIGKSYSDLAALVEYPQYTSKNSVFTDRQIRDYDLPHLMLCETAVEATRSANLAPESLQKSRTNIYVGHVLTSKLDVDYSNGVHAPQLAALFRTMKGAHALPTELVDQVAHRFVKRMRDAAPNRKQDCNPNLNSRFAAELIADFFKLDAPHTVFNAACASSLQALTHAIKGIELGKCDTAIVSGASFFHSDSLVLFSAARSLSKKGSYPFTEDADGLIIGEGYVTVILKRLSAVLRDGNPILATLPSVGISSDGKGKSLWAPRLEGQIKAIKRAYRDGADMSTIQYIEAHATSTSLGDKTEVQAICEAFGNSLPADRKIPIGSIKRNVGHTLEVAGLAGLIKVVLAMKHGIIPPSIPSDRKRNPAIDWDHIPFFVSDQPISWNQPADGSPRRAAVEAFGIGGLNVHLVVEQFCENHALLTNRTNRPSQEFRSAGKKSPVQEKQAMAIVGAGLVVPGARSLDAFAQLVEEQRSQRKPIPPHRYDVSLFSKTDSNPDWALTITEAGVVDDFEYDWKTHRIPPKQIANASSLQFMTLDAVEQAFHQYCTTTKNRNQKEENCEKGNGTLLKHFLDLTRVGCIVGTEFTGEFSAHLAIGLRLPEIEQVFSKVLREYNLPNDQIQNLVVEFRTKVLKRFSAILDETGSFTASTLATRITKTFDFMGVGLAVDAREPSVAALDCCSDMLHTDACDLMVCVGAQQEITPEMFQILQLSGTLDTAEGNHVPGEGCVALLLKRPEDARRNGDQILGTIRGWGIARGQDLRTAHKCAVKRAMHHAGFANFEPDAVEIVPAGTEKDYQTQCQEMSRNGTAFKRSGLFGAAAGMESILKVLLALERKEKETFPSNRFAPNDNHTSIPDKQFRGIVNIAKPGNHSYHIIIERGVPVALNPSNGPDTVPSSNSRSVVNGLIHFDATAVRRAKMVAAARRRTANATPKSVPPSQEEAKIEKASPSEGKGTISLAPITAVALSPSRQGPTVPAAKPKS